MTRGKKLLLSILAALVMGGILTALVWLLPLPLNPSDACFYGGLVLLLAGLVAMLRGNANMYGGDGTNINFATSVALQEAQDTKSHGSNFRRNHVLDVNLAGVFLFLLGVALLCGGIFPTLQQ